MSSADSAIAQMQAMARDLRQMPFRVRNAVAIAVKNEMNDLLQEQFDGGFGPDGSAWAPLAQSTVKRGRTPPPLTDTHRMRDHVKAVRVGTNVAIDSELPAAYHQRGHRQPTPLPRRPIWPEDGEDMPERWESRISLAGNEAMVRAIRSPILSAAE